MVAENAACDVGSSSASELARTIAVRRPKARADAPMPGVGLGGWGGLRPRRRRVSRLRAPLAEAGFVGAVGAVGAVPVGGVGLSGFGVDVAHDQQDADPQRREEEAEV